MANTDEAPSQERYFQLSGAGNSPWELHRPQPIIVELVQQGYFQGNVLDLGCGIADNAIYIANHAKMNHLTAIDLVPKAIEVAREKAEKANVKIDFQIIDFLKDISTSNIPKYSFDTILDSAVFHSFSNEDRQYYMKNLEYLIKPDGLYIQICFSEKETRELVPRRIKKSDLYDLFSLKNGWKIESIQDTIYELKSDQPTGIDGQAYLSFIRRQIN